MYKGHWSFGSGVFKGKRDGIRIMLGGGFAPIALVMLLMNMVGCIVIVLLLMDGVLMRVGLGLVIDKFKR